MAPSGIEKLSLTKMHEIINSHNIIPLSMFSPQPSSSDVTIELGIGQEELVIAVTRYAGVSASDGAVDYTTIPYVTGSVHDIATGLLEIRWSIDSLFVAEFGEEGVGWAQYTMASVLRLGNGIIDTDILSFDAASNEWTVNVSTINNCSKVTFDEFDVNVPQDGTEHSVILSSQEQLTLPKLQSAVVDGLPLIANAIDFKYEMTRTGAEHFDAAVTSKSLALLSNIQELNYNDYGKGQIWIGSSTNDNALCFDLTDSQATIATTIIGPCGPDTFIDIDIPESINTASWDADYAYKWRLHGLQDDELPTNYGIKTPHHANMSTPYPLYTQYSSHVGAVDTTTAYEYLHDFGAGGWVKEYGWLPDPSPMLYAPGGTRLMKIVSFANHTDHIHIKAGDGLPFLAHTHAFSCGDITNGKFILRHLPLSPNTLHNAVTGEEFVADDSVQQATAVAGDHDDYLKVTDGSTGPIIGVEITPASTNLGRLTETVSGSGVYVRSDASESWDIAYDQYNDAFQNSIDIKALIIPADPSRIEPLAHIPMKFDISLGVGKKRYSWTPPAGPKVYIKYAPDTGTLTHSGKATAMATEATAGGTNEAILEITYIGFYSDGIGTTVSTVPMQLISTVNGWTDTQLTNALALGSIVVAESDDVTSDGASGFLATAGYIAFPIANVYSEANDRFSSSSFTQQLQSGSMQLGDGSADNSVLPMTDTYLDSTTLFVNFRATIVHDANVMKVRKINECVLDTTSTITTVSKFSLDAVGVETGLDTILNLKRDYYLSGSLDDGTGAFVEITNNNIPGYTGSGIFPTNVRPGPYINDGFVYGVQGSLLLNDYSEIIKVHYGVQDFEMVNISKVRSSVNYTSLRNVNALGSGEKYAISIVEGSSYPEFAAAIKLEVKLLDASNNLTGDALQNIEFLNKYSPTVVRVGAMIGLMEDSWGRIDWPFDTNNLKLSYPTDLQSRINFTEVFNNLNTSINSLVSKMNAELSYKLAAKMSTLVITPIGVHNNAVNAKVKLIDDDRILTKSRIAATELQLVIVKKSRDGTVYQGDFKIDTVDPIGKSIDYGIVSETEVMTGGVGGVSQIAAFNNNNAHGTGTGDHIAERTTAISLLDKAAAVDAYNKVETTLQNNITSSFETQMGIMEGHNSADTQDINSLKVLIENAENYMEELRALKDHLQAIFNDR